MGWLFKPGSIRRELVAERTKGWERASSEMLVESRCLAHCFRGGRFSCVLWSVWERTFTKDGQEVEPRQRWIQCDLLKYNRTKDGWGYKDMEESMHPYFYSCPLGYLKMVPVAEFGGNEEWRKCVRSYHQRLKKNEQRSMPSNLHDLEAQLHTNLGCWHHYRLRIWQDCSSFDSASEADRIRIAKEVLADPHRGEVT